MKTVAFAKVDSGDGGHLAVYLSISPPAELSSIPVDLEPPDVQIGLTTLSAVKATFIRPRQLLVRTDYDCTDQAFTQGGTRKYKKKYIKKFNPVRRSTFLATKYAIWKLVDFVQPGIGYRA